MIPVYKKIIAFIDTGWEMVLPLVACIYLVYTDSEYANQIIIYGWISFLIHIVMSLHVFTGTKSIYGHLLSLINTGIVLAMIYMDYLTFWEFAVVFLVSESVSVVLAIMFFLIFKKGVDGESAWKSLGPAIVILNLIIFSGTAYPFLKEYQSLIEFKAVDSYYWYGAISFIVFAIWKKIGGLDAFLDGRDNQDNADTIIKSKKLNETTLILLFLLIWFGTLIPIAVFVQN